MKYYYTTVRMGKVLNLKKDNTTHWWEYRVTVDLIYNDLGYKIVQLLWQTKEDKRSTKEDKNLLYDLAISLL